MRRATYDVMEGGLSQEAPALQYNIRMTTFRMYIKKCQENRNNIEWTSDVLEEAPRLTEFTIWRLLTRKKNLCHGKTTRLRASFGSQVLGNETQNYHYDQQKQL